MDNTNLSKEEIINRIGYFRNKRKLSAYKLGMELGHARNYFYRIESGEIQLTLDLLLDVLQILGVSTFEFFYPNLSKFESDTRLLRSFQELSEEEQKSLQTLIERKK